MPVLTLRFVSRGRAGECLRSAGIPNRDTPGKGLGFWWFGFFFFYIISTCLKEKSAQMSKQQIKRITIEGLSLRSPFNVSQDF